MAWHATRRRAAAAFVVCWTLALSPAGGALAVPDGVLVGSAASCAADEFRYGRWELQAPASADAALGATTCTTYEYVNTSCGPAFSMAGLCEALRCRNLLLVGDSLMGDLYLALKAHRDAASTRERTKEGLSNDPAVLEGERPKVGRPQPSSAASLAGPFSSLSQLAPAQPIN